MQYLSPIARGARGAEPAEAVGFCAAAGPAEDRSLDIAMAMTAMITSNHNFCLKICISADSSDALYPRAKAFVAGIFPQGSTPSKGLPPIAEFCHI
jgi:hypothetical protein